MDRNPYPKIRNKRRRAQRVEEREEKGWRDDKIEEKEMCLIEEKKLATNHKDKTYIYNTFMTKQSFSFYLNITITTYQINFNLILQLLFITYLNHNQSLTKHLLPNLNQYRIQFNWSMRTLLPLLFEGAFILSALLFFSFCLLPLAQSMFHP